MGSASFTLEAAASFGLEALVRDELQSLGVRVLSTEDRRVVFEGTARDVARCNLRLRTADRVWLRLGEFPAATFDELYDGVRAVPWKEVLPPSAAVDVLARSSRSRLSAVPSIQSVSKRALVDALLGRKSSGARMEETGTRHDVEVVLRQDRAAVLLDTSGQGLHKRGYRSGTGPAPLRENLAAALVLLSRWDSGRPFADPLCGSGTIAIEAALAACSAAPGLNRGFAGEDLPLTPVAVWREAREEARAEVKSPAGLVIEASDHDAGVVAAARSNARAAGVLKHIRFMNRALDAFQSPGNYGCMVCNPPYGERMGDQHQADELARRLGLLSRQLPTWSFFILTGSADFPRLFGSPSSRNRKLYNGNIRCWLYQYFGPLP